MIEGIRPVVTSLEEIWDTARHYGTPSQIIDSVMRSVKTHRSEQPADSGIDAQIVQFPVKELPPTE